MSLFDEIRELIKDEDKASFALAMRPGLLRDVPKQGVPRNRNLIVRDSLGRKGLQQLTCERNALRGGGGLFGEIQ